MASSIDVKNKIQEHKTLKIASFKKEVRVTKPHKHNSYFEIIYLKKGTGHHFIDSQHYDVVPGSVFFVRKEQMHHWDLTSEPDGYVIIIKTAFVEQGIDKEMQDLFYQLSHYNFIQLTETSLIDKLFLALCEEHEAEGWLSKIVTKGLLTALLAKILTHGDKLDSGKVKLSKGLYPNFIEALTQTEKLINSVSYYADLLNTSAQNLNKVCKKETNLSASSIIAEYIINEAKRYLIYTDKTVAEIAFKLNFNDSSHFVKYFKRFTTYTPLVYRESC